jgi:IclR family acetate operon transcriptional repressor
MLSSVPSDGNRVEGRIVTTLRSEAAAARREGNGRSGDVTESESASGTIQSVQRALYLLSLFAPHRMPQVPRRTQWSVSDLARASGLHKSVVARLMATMAADGWVVQDPRTRTYQIGPQAFAVGSVYEPSSVLDRVARPVMETLTARGGHASYLGVPAGRHYVFVVAVESTRSLRVTIEIGESRTYNSGAIGKILLAALDDDRIRELVGPDPLPQLTPFTLATQEALLREIGEIRRSGIAFNREESILGAGSIAVGIDDRRGERVAGLAVVYPVHVVTEAETAQLVAAVAAAGAEISQRLGSLQEF